MNKKTVLFIMPRLPFPAVSGRKTSLYHYCRILNQELGFRLVVAAFLEAGDNQKNVPDFISRLEVLPAPSFKEKIVNILKYSVLRKKLPLQVSLFLSEKAGKMVEKIIEEENPTVIIADMVRTTEYIKDKKEFTVADLDDRISLRYKRQLIEDIKGINPYGAFINTVPGCIRKLFLVNVIKKNVVKREIELLDRYEKNIGKICSSTVFVAQKEANDFNNELGEKKAYAVPIGVDTAFFSYRECGNDDNMIGFLGALNVAHNENAVKHFIEHIFPKIIKKVPNAKFVVIGGGASKELLDYASENVIFTGRVEDIRKHLQQCKVFVCPMTFGSGIKTKNLEAMSMGLPIVTTEIGAENIDAKNMEDWVIANSEEDFADNVIKLIRNHDFRINIGKRGSEFVNKNFTWDTTKDSLYSLLENFQIL